MSRNANSRFALNPNINIGRSKFGRHASVKLSGNVGEIVPFYVDEVLPGDTFEVKTNKVVRLQTLIAPIMDNMYLDTYFFFVPYRLVWQHWKEFNGENTQSAWAPQVEYTIPQVTAPESGWNIGTIADYLGIPTGIGGLSVSALPFRAYALICSEWFRAEALSDPLNVPVDDATVVGVNTGNFVTDVVKGGLPYTAAKYADYFTSCLPAPQRGPEVTIPLTNDGNFPVTSLSDAIPSSLLGNPMRVVTPSGSVPSMGDSELGIWNLLGYSSYGTVSTRRASGTDSNVNQTVTPSNLWAINDGALVGASINSLRLAFQIQKLYEKDARGGGRYIEIIKSHFGVTSPDARLQRPEYLGGNRIPLTINQVIQQSATTEDSPQGNTAAMSLTTDSHFDFKRSFTEHGIVIGMMVVRYDHTYQQGIERFWSRKDRFDFYWPVLANIGEQAVLNKELYATGTSTDEEVFGYQEAWADYRYKPSRVCGEMRSAAAQSLDSWHLADDYASQPYLSDAWIREDKAPVDRALAVTSSVSNQYFADVYVQNWSTRPMPVYSIPGLIDHH